MYFVHTNIIIAISTLLHSDSTLFQNKKNGELPTCFFRKRAPRLASFLGTLLFGFGLLGDTGAAEGHEDVFPASLLLVEAAFEVVEMVVSGAERGFNSAFGGHNKCCLTGTTPVSHSSKNSRNCRFWDCNTWYLVGFWSLVSTWKKKSTKWKWIRN